jgi:porphobilinogen synthase
MKPVFPEVRLRRLRQNQAIRSMVKETGLSISQLIYPLFVRHGSQWCQPILSLPGIMQRSVDMLDQELAQIQELAIPAVLLFGIPQNKDAIGSDSYSQQGVIQSAIRYIKEKAPNLIVITDVCLCEYTDHGHCGVVSNADQIDNDATLPLLVKQALSHAAAGADIIAPSGMMDGVVLALRQGLDAAGYHQLPIMSYAVKYASAFYGPFRDAAEGAPAFGDRSTHQMDPANRLEALRECALDIAEGADFLMVKPAGAYLDIITAVKQTYPEMPLVAYQVSGEYAMLKAAAHMGWLDEKKVVLESLLGIRRAGAQMIITYYAKEVAAWLSEKH